MGFGGFSAYYTALKTPGLVDKISGQSLFMYTEEQQLRALVPTAVERPLQLYLEWGKYDARGSLEGWDMGSKTRLRQRSKGQGPYLCRRRGERRLQLGQLEESDRCGPGHPLSDVPAGRVRHCSWMPR